jgi:hypothetical protein
MKNREPAYLREGPVPNSDLKAVVQQIDGHGLPHYSQPQEPYLHCHFFRFFPSLLLALD